MNLGQLRNRVKRQIPQATGDSINDGTINDELNHGVDEVNLMIMAYKTFKDIQNVPNQQVYSLSTICPGYLSMSKSGVWWFDQNGKSKRVYSKTIRWLDNFLQNWRDQAPGIIPTWYWHENDDLGFQPAVSLAGSSSANFFRVHYLVEASPMTQDANYPWWNRSNELSALRAADNAIVAYAVWKLSPAVLDKEGRNYYETQFEKECKKASAVIKRQWDLTSSPEYYIVPDVAQGFLPR